MRKEHSRLMKGSIQEVIDLKDPWLKTVGARAAGTSLVFPWAEESHGPSGSGRVPHPLSPFILVPWCLVLSLQICRCSPHEVPVHERLTLPVGGGC